MTNQIKKLRHTFVCYIPNERDRLWVSNNAFLSCKVCIIKDICAFNGSPFLYKNELVEFFIFLQRNTVVVSPVIDFINSETFDVEFTRSNQRAGCFESNA